jgi:c-di-GMP-binding flagellar brake protein YcgR
MKKFINAARGKAPFALPVIGCAWQSFCQAVPGGTGFARRASVSDDAQREFFSNLHSVFSDVNVSDFLGWNTPRFVVNVIIVSFIFASVVLAVVFAARRMLQKKMESIDRQEALYSENIDRCRLTDEEAALLQSLARRKNLAQPHIIFQSLQVFEECVDAEVRSLMENPAAVDEKKMRDLFSDLRMKMGFFHLPLEYPLASTRNISIGQTGSLFSATDNRMLFRKVSVSDNTAFFLSFKYNVEKEEIRRMAPGQKVRFAFARRNDGLYGIQTVVVKADRAGFFDVSHTCEMKRNQLRQFVRIETSLPLSFRLIKTQDSEKSEVKPGDVINAKLCDISGGGLSFLYERSLRLGDIVSLNFNLPGAPCAGIVGKIVHLSLRDVKEKTLFKNHVQFLNIEPRKREKIISYIFEKERHINQWR